MLGVFLFISGQEIIFALLIALLLFGSKEIPRLARTFGKGMKEFRRATDDIKREFEESNVDVVKDFKEIKNNLTKDADDIKKNITREADHIKKNITRDADDIKRNITREADHIKKNITRDVEDIKEDIKHDAEEAKSNLSGQPKKESREEPKESDRPGNPEDRSAASEIVRKKSSRGVKKDPDTD